MLASWWGCAALPRCGAWWGPGSHRWLPPTAADWAAGDAAAHAAAQLLTVTGAVFDTRDFARRHARYHVADRVDVWALARAGAAAWPHWAQVSGELPTRGPYLALTLHWGAGMWAHAAFARHHARSRWLYAPPTPVPDRWMARLQALRLRALSSAMGHPPLPTGGSAEQMVRWWCDGGGIMALFDAPHGGRRRCVALPSALLGTLYVPVGLFALAVAHGVPVYFYRCHIPDNDGLRHIEVAPPVRCHDVEALAAHAAAWLDASLRLDPAAWHFWAGLKHLQTPPISGPWPSAREEMG